MAIIRQRTERDLEGCVEVLKRVHATSGYPVNGTDHAAAFLDYASLRQSWVAEENGQVVGHVSVATPAGDDISAVLWHELYPGEPAATLERLFVHPDVQGKGIARQLMLAATSWGQQSDTRLLLFALVKDQGAIGMYRKLGWVEYGTREFHWGDGESMAAICFASPKNIERVA
ncbi:acyltransferase like protein [Teratosphaeria destructans]|uniref:Acyltransferase like protein n=1 Tax=Teratosphaeria destructans TaxID=418781 RepID=A0A9W7SNQ5_9PEZI|nr:acyltransferase like protein [Teratosphaeria destructans]